MDAQPASPPTVEADRWDLLSLRLQELRDAADTPSFGEIATRISAQRQRNGAAPAAARIARSSVYDAFRTGRTRVNIALVREIALALGGTDAQVDSWVAECRGDPVTVAPGTDDSSAAVTVRDVVLVMVVSLGINLVGRELVVFLELSIYADMIGTAVAAMVLGPWRGAAVGIATNLIGVIPSGWESLPFAVVNVAGALVWGYGVRRWRMGRSLPRFFVLNLLVAAVCSMLAVPVLLGMYGGSVGHPQDVISLRVLDLTGSLSVAVSASNLLTSMVDKLMTGFVALVVIMAMPPRYKQSMRGNVVISESGVV